MSLQDDLFDILEINTNKHTHIEIPTSSNHMHNSASTFNDFLDELIEIPIIPYTTKKIHHSNTQEEEAMWGEIDDDAFCNFNESSPHSNKTPQEIDLLKFGFKTGSGKAIKPVSEEALRKSRALLSEEPIQEPREVDLNQVGFTTGSGKALKPVSEEAVRKAKALLNETLVNDPADTPKPVKIEEFPTFKTGSGKELTISQAAVEKAEAWLLEKNSKEANRTVEKMTSTMFTTGSGKTMTASKRESDKWLMTLFETEERGVKRTIERKPDKRGLHDISNVKRHRRSTLEKRNKPFKSPIIHSNIELTKAAIGNKNIQRAKSVPSIRLDDTRQT